MRPADPALSIDAVTGRRWLALGLAAAAVGLLGPRLSPDWALLADQPLAIKLHLAAAIPALALGAVLMTGRKGDRLHRRLGWAWVLLMAVTAASSFFIDRVGDAGFSFIHGLSAWTLLMLPVAVLAARRRWIRVHRRTMGGMFYGGLLLAGALAFLPGRLLPAILFG